MKKNPYTFLKNLIGSIIGIYAGYCLATYINYRRHPQLYALQSAPWYTELILAGILAGSVCLILAEIRYLMSKRQIYPVFKRYLWYWIIQSVKEISFYETRNL